MHVASCYRFVVRQDFSSRVKMQSRAKEQVCSYLNRNKFKLVCIDLNCWWQVEKRG